MVEPVGNGAAAVVNPVDARQIVLHLLLRLAEVLAVPMLMQTLHVLQLGPGLWIDV